VPKGTTFGQPPKEPWRGEIRDWKGPVSTADALKPNVDPATLKPPAAPAELAQHAANPPVQQQLPFGSAAPPAPTPTAEIPASAPAPKPPPAVVPVIEEANSLSKGIKWVAETAPKVAESFSQAAHVFGQVTIVAGAYQEALKTAQPEVDRRGELSGAITSGTSFLIGLGAGVVDDALVAWSLREGAALPVVLSQYDGFAGPVQQAAGSAYRSANEWLAKNLW